MDTGVASADNSRTIARRRRAGQGDAIWRACVAADDDIRSRTSVRPTDQRPGADDRHAHLRAGCNGSAGVSIRGAAIGAD